MQRFLDPVSCLLASLLLVMAAGSTSVDAGYPERPIRFLVPSAGGTPEQFAALIKSETTKWAEVIRRTGAKVD